MTFTVPWSWIKKGLLCLAIWLVHGCGRYSSDIIPPPPPSQTPSPDEDAPRCSSLGEPSPKGEAGRLAQEILLAVESGNGAQFAALSDQWRALGEDSRPNLLAIRSENGHGLLALAIQSGQINLVEQLLALEPALNPLSQLNDIEPELRRSLFYKITGQEPDQKALDERLLALIKDVGYQPYDDDGQLTAKAQKALRAVSQQLLEGADVHAGLNYQVDAKDYQLTALLQAMGLELSSNGRIDLVDKIPLYELASLLLCTGADREEKLAISFFGTTDEVTPFGLAGGNEQSAPLGRLMERLVRKFASKVQETPYSLSQWQSLLDPNTTSLAACQKGNL